MSLNSNWSRWITASVNDHFASQSGIVKLEDWSSGDSDLPLIVRGQQFETDTDRMDLVELRLDGPDFAEVSINHYHAYIEVNTLIQSVISETDIYKMARSIGIVQACFTDIPLYKYGDDDSLFGCLTLIANPTGTKGNRLEVSQFGQIDPRLKLEQTTIEGHYFGWLEGD